MLQVSVLCHSDVILSCDVMVTYKLSEYFIACPGFMVISIHNRDSYVVSFTKEGVQLNKGSLSQTRVAIRSL